MNQFEHLQPSLSLSHQWLGMGSVCSDRGYRFEPGKALCGEGWED